MADDCGRSSRFAYPERFELVRRGQPILLDPGDVGAQATLFAFEPGGLVAAAAGVQRGIGEALVDLVNCVFHMTEQLAGHRQKTMAAQCGRAYTPSP